MADRKTTDESLAKALEFVKDMGQIRQAIAALTVPVQEEGWVEVDEVHVKTYQRGKYFLTRFLTTQNWVLYYEKLEIARHPSLLSSEEAQAWANGIIREREASIVPPACDYCMMGLPRNRLPIVHENKTFCSMNCAESWITKNKSQPAPFGVGSEFIMPNGDRVRVMRQPIEKNILFVANLSTNTTELFDVGYPKENWTNPDDLRAALEAAGAKAV